MKQIFKSFVNYLKQKIKNYFRFHGFDKKDTLKVIFDVETNGLSNCSVLSFSALLLDSNNDIKYTINRYYYKEEGEKENRKALKINGLYQDVIKTKRRRAKYPKYFKDDKYIVKLMKRANVLIAHNIKFDLGHVLSSHKGIKIKNKEFICTMLATQRVYDTPYTVGGKPKYPKLSEAVEYFNIDVDKIKNKHNIDYHDSFFDVLATYEVYLKLVELSEKEKHSS